jgi:hypothetical protein
MRRQLADPDLRCVLTHPFHTVRSVNASQYNPGRCINLPVRFPDEAYGYRGIDLGKGHGRTIIDSEVQLECWKLIYRSPEKDVTLSTINNEGAGIVDVWRVGDKGK